MTQQKLEQIFSLNNTIDTIKLHLHRGLPTSSSVKEILQFLNWHNTGAVMIQENSFLVGIFTERDLLAKIYGFNYEKQTDFLSHSITEYMTSHPTTLNLNNKIGQAFYIMYAKGIRHIPILDEKGLPYALMSIRDITTNIFHYSKQELLDKFKVDF